MKPYLFQSLDQNKCLCLQITMDLTGRLAELRAFLEAGEGI